MDDSKIFEGENQVGKQLPINPPQITWETNIQSGPFHSTDYHPIQHKNVTAMVLSLTFVQVIHIPVTAHTRYWVLHSYVLNQLSSYINMYIQTTLINFTIDLCKLHRLDL